MSRPSFFIFICAAACSSPSATLVVTLGGAPDTLTKSPAVATMEVDVVDRTGAVTATILAETPLAASGSTVDLGDVSQTLVGSIQFIGRDAAHDVVVSGAVPYAEIGALTGNVPLFVQRVGELAQMPNTIADARRKPFLAISPRSLYVAGGTIDGVTTEPPLVGYDLLGLTPIITTFAAPALPDGNHAMSFALVQLTQETSIGDLAVAMWLDASGESIIGLGTAARYPSVNNLEPDGKTPLFKWSDVAGGTTVIGDDGTAYIIGGSRMSAPPSPIVFAILSSNNAQQDIFPVYVATRARQGAAVAWATGKGVFIYGGSSDTGTAGVELLAYDASKAIFSDTASYPPDGTQGLAAASFGDQIMLLAGDGNQPRKIDLTCNSLTCAPAPWGATPPALVSPSMFAIGKQTFLIVGDDASTGSTRVIKFDATSANDIPLNIARQGARAIQTQTGAVLIVGGGTDVIESYVPSP